MTKPDNPDIPAVGEVSGLYVVHPAIHVFSNHTDEFFCLLCRSSVQSNILAPAVYQQPISQQPLYEHNRMYIMDHLTDGLTKGKRLRDDLILQLEPAHAVTSSTTFGDGTSFIVYSPNRPNWAALFGEHGVIEFAYDSLWSVAIRSVANGDWQILGLDQIEVFINEPTLRGMSDYIRRYGAGQRR